MNLKSSSFFILHYINTYFLINAIPVTIIIETVNVNIIYVGAVPVEIDKITSASSISSSSFTLLSGVESISGVLLSFLS